MITLKKKYFSNLQKVIHLKKDEFLFHQNDINHQLFLVESGTLNGFDPADQTTYFSIDPNDFIGLYSFFSSSSIVQMSIIAKENCVLHYFEKNLYETDDTESREITYDFMPYVMKLLIQRQQQMQQARYENEKTIEQMKDVERLASLGQLSAGVAHELNNAITVIARGSSHISDKIIQHLSSNPFETEMLITGLKEGRIVSSAESRKIAKELTQKSNISYEQLRDYARTGMIKKLIQKKENLSQKACELWQLGATLHDLQLAVTQSEHVINSMRSLASTNVIRQSDCDVNESIQKAIFLLASPLNKVKLTLDLNKISSIFGNPGELVQIWSNITKNAIDAMDGQSQKDSCILIKSELNNHHIKVTIQDSGPGIPPEMLNEIFKPHVTTKKQGQTFGLGLGLTIVQKIINRYSGELLVNSSPQGTIFTILLPIGEPT